MQKNKKSIKYAGIGGPGEEDITGWAVGEEKIIWITSDHLIPKL